MENPISANRERERVALVRIRRKIIKEMRGTALGTEEIDFK